MLYPMNTKKEPGTLDRMLWALLACGNLTALVWTDHVFRRQNILYYTVLLKNHCRKGLTCTQEKHTVFFCLYLTRKGKTTARLVAPWIQAYGRGPQVGHSTRNPTPRCDCRRWDHLPTRSETPPQLSCMSNVRRQKPSTWPRTRPGSPESPTKIFTK